MTLTWQQLATYAKKNGYRYSTAALRRWMAKQPIVARFSHHRKQRLYQSFGFLRPGCFQVDYAEYGKGGPQNQRFKGFILFVENVTNWLHVVPVRRKGLPEWRSAVQSLVDHHGEVRSCTSDRDPAVTGPAFMEHVKARHGISWHFLTLRNKAYLAERFIGIVKRKLSMATAANRTKNWLQYVAPIVRAHNEERIGRTNFTRKQVKRRNFLKFLQALFPDVEDARMLMLLDKQVPLKSPRANRRLFKFGIGDSVYLRKQSQWTRSMRRDNETIGRFRASRDGSFGTKIYTISGMLLRTNKHFDKYIQGG